MAMALPMHRAAALLLLLLASPLLCAAQAPISQPPSPGAPTASPLLHPDSTPADDADGESISPSAAPAQSPAGQDDKAAFPPSPAETAPAPAKAPAPASSSSPHSTAPAPAPATDAHDEHDEGRDEYKDEAPAPAPAAMEVKSGTGADVQPQAVDSAEAERREGMSGGKKAGVVVGVFSAAAVVGLAAVVYRKRQANIRRSRYADYSARLELV